MEPLTTDLLIAAYSQGYFPMGVHGDIGWFSPDPRAILPLDKFHASQTLRATYRRKTFDIRVDTSFATVMKQCAERPEGTWIVPEIVRAYCELHELGLAHSVEAWKDGRLAGGLYGVCLGGAFFGESMFHRVRDASKVALVALVERLRERGFAMLEVQYMTDHLRRFGAVEITKRAYMRRLAAALKLRRQFAD